MDNESNCPNCGTILKAINNKKICPNCGIVENNEVSESGGAMDYIG